MKPKISEFSYGFALTTELVRWADLSAAPVFPSLLEEGGPGGGFDLKLDRPGAPLYLQFKRSECMRRRGSREWHAVKAFGGDLTVPHYRFEITSALESDQHELLLALEYEPNLVFYAAPRFHEISEINEAWHDAAVSARSVFVAPSEIGSLDEQLHRVTFDADRTWICSEPREIRALNSRDLLEKIRNALRHEDRTIRDRLPAIAESLHRAEVRGREQAEIKRDAYERRLEEAGRAASVSSGLEPFHELRRAIPVPDVLGSTEAISLGRLERPEPDPPALRPARWESADHRRLSDIADHAARVFETQLVIVQRQED